MDNNNNNNDNLWPGVVAFIALLLFVYGMTVVIYGPGW